MIPVHQPQLKADERLSLQACKTHLSTYDCYLVYPDGMDTGAYTTAYPGLLLKPVKADWLASIEAYNRMKISLDFYYLFSNYTHLLTYELDAYIFNANLEAANVFKCDFIGAPFFEGYWAAQPGAPLMKGCNSGFSVRNIQSCIRVLSEMKKFRFRWMLYQVFLAPVRRFRLWLNKATGNRYKVFITGSFGFYFGDFHLNEDLVWTEVVPQLFPDFKIADPMSALQFSFEYNLNESLKLNGGRLPLGCHAWYKHLDFWKEYINTDTLA
jgi:hypothetical protein